MLFELILSAVAMQQEQHCTLIGLVTYNITKTTVQMQDNVPKEMKVKNTHSKQKTKSTVPTRHQEILNIV